MNMAGVLQGASECFGDSHEVIEGDLAGGLLIICDHASNAIPPEYGTLGLPRPELDRHIGYDIGCDALSRALAERLRAPAIVSLFSRLLIDPNRGEDDPTLIMRISDGAIVPGNAGVDADERERRLDRFYRPYHGGIENLITAAMATGRAPALLSIHSFTSSWKGWQRPWHAGILWDKDPRFAMPLLDRLCAEHSLRVGDNEPYSGALHNDTMYRHGTQRGLTHALIEIRNDLIATPAGIQEWADRLEPILRDILQDGTLNAVQHFGSHSDFRSTRKR